jgi:nicotinamidase/pyrazinamidase
LKVDWPRIDASQDWHPPDHRSFFGQKDNLYPPHCVAGTKGAEFLPGLHTQLFHTIWRKGYERDVETYAITAQHPAYAELLRKSGMTTVVVCGLAINICCFFAARDLRQAGFRVLLVEDASAGIDVQAANLFQDRAKKEGQGMGIEYLCTRDVFNALGLG